jgi:hypothetical protein
LALGVTLLSAAAATGSAVRTSGGRKAYFIYGTWDGATATLQWSPNGGTTWFSVAGSALTANGTFTDLPLSDGHCRVLISGAGGTTSLSSEIEDIK